MIGFIYRKIIKPILFKFPADDIHNLFLKTGNIFGRENIIKKVFQFSLYLQR